MKKVSLFIGLLMIALLTETTAGIEMPAFGPPVYVTAFPETGLAYTMAPDPRKGFPDILVLSPHGAGARAVLFQGYGKGNEIWKDSRVIENKGFEGGRSIEMIDINGDGKLDILTVSRGKTFILLGDSFSKTFKVPEVPSPVTFLTGDLNNDGQVDLIVGSLDENLYVLMGKGSGGGFSSPLRVPLKGIPQNMVMGDFNGDRIPDVAVIFNKSGENILTVLFGDGKGGLKSEGSPTFSLPGDSIDIAAGDLNGDGLDDVVTSSSAKHSLIFLTGSKDGLWKLGSFTSPLLETTVGLVLGDFYLNGKTDIALTSSGKKEDSLVIVKNDGSGNFSLTKNDLFSLGSGRVPAGHNPIIAIDVDRDGDLDFVVGTDGKSLIVMKNNIRH